MVCMIAPKDWCTSSPNRMAEGRLERTASPQSSRVTGVSAKVPGEVSRKSPAAVTAFSTRRTARRSEPVAAAISSAGSGPSASSSGTPSLASANSAWAVQPPVSTPNRVARSAIDGLRSSSECSGRSACEGRS